MHVGKTRACGEVLAAQRMLGEKVDMVCDNHQVANLEGRVHTTCSIRHEERLNAQLVHHSYGEGDILHRVAFVEMETTLHGEDVHPAEFAEDKGTGMSLYGRNGEVGNLTVGNYQLIGYLGS